MTRHVVICSRAALIAVVRKYRLLKSAKKCYATDFGRSISVAAKWIGGWPPVHLLIAVLAGLVSWYFWERGKDLPLPPQAQNVTRLGTSSRDTIFVFGGSIGLQAFYQQQLPYMAALLWHTCDRALHQPHQLNSSDERVDIYRPSMIRISAGRRSRSGGSCMTAAINISTNAGPAWRADSRYPRRAGSSILATNSGYPWQILHRVARHASASAHRAGCARIADGVTLVSVP